MCVAGTVERERVRFTEQTINAFLLGAMIGGAIGAVSTYLIATQEKRLIARIRRSIELSCSYDHNLTDTQHQKLKNLDALVSNRQILASYQLSLEHKAMCRKRRPDDLINKISPHTIAAEIIIYEMILDLTHLDAIQALRRQMRGQNG